MLEVENQPIPTVELIQLMAGLALAICGEIEIGADGDGLTASDPGEERTSSHDDW